MNPRAVQADRMGGIDVLTVREVAAPTPGASEVLVRTVASSVNPIDSKLRTNANLTFPLTLGWDIAGIVVESNAAEYRPGDRVIAMNKLLDSGFGAWADLVALDAATLAPAPVSVSLSEAATIPLAGLTALRLWNTPVLSAGDRVLVTGAAGAIGGFVVQFAANAGIQADGLVSRPDHVNVVKSLGAGFVTTDPAVLPRKAYIAVVDTINLPSKGVDVRDLVTEEGQYVATGPADAQVPRSHSVHVAHDPEGLRLLVKMVDDGTLALRVAAHYGLHEIQDAQAHAEAGGLNGKVVLHF